MKKVRVNLSVTVLAREERGRVVGVVVVGAVVAGVVVAVFTYQYYFAGDTRVKGRNGMLKKTKN